MRAGPELGLQAALTDPGTALQDRKVLRGHLVGRGSLGGDNTEPPRSLTKTLVSRRGRAGPRCGADPTILSVLLS